MINTSAAYDTAVYATERETKAKIVFDILDVDANTDATATVTSEETFSDSTQLFDQVREPSYKYATLENDFWKLDGSFVLTPTEAEIGTNQIGWWSTEISDINGDFGTYQVATIDFTTNHSSIGLTITFDTFVDEYAENFTIVFKDSGGSTLHTETVTGNTANIYKLYQNVSNYRQVIITITKWVKPYRRVRCVEIDFGIVETYTDNEIVKVNVLEEVDTLSNQITSNELNFTLDNQDKRFNIVNPDGVYAYLQRNQKVYSYIGVVKENGDPEYIPMGIFYLREWKSDEGTLTATFTARDLIDVLCENNFSSKTYTSKSLKYIIDDIMSDIGIDDYNVDSTLDSIIVTATLPDSTYREVIQKIAMAGLAVVYCDRNGTIQIKQLSTTSTVDTIDFDNIYNTPSIILDKVINTIYVKYASSVYTLVDPDKPSNEATLSVEIDNPLITTLSHAEDIADWILTELKKRYNYEINWRSNPAHEICDIVTIEDDFSENKTARITKQEFDYIGFLGGKTYAKGDGT